MLPHFKGDLKSCRASANVSSHLINVLRCDAKSMPCWRCILELGREPARLSYAPTTKTSFICSYGLAVLFLNAPPVVSRTLLLSWTVSHPPNGANYMFAAGARVQWNAAWSVVTHRPSEWCGPSSEAGL